MGVGHYFMQVINMSIMYNKQRDELHISVNMKDICIIMENYIMHVYLNKHIYICIEESIISKYIYISKGSPCIIYKKGPYLKSMPHTCSRGYEENNYIHVYICILMEHHNKMTYNLQQRLLQAAAEIIKHNNIDVMPILNSLNYI